MGDKIAVPLLNPSPMNGGKGTYSYSKNSIYQGEALVIAKDLMNEVINGLDTKTFTSSSNAIRIADLGCSVGPNTFLAVQNIAEAVQKKYQSDGLSNSSSPEFQVFFNDLPTNDFNTLFDSLPPVLRRKPFFVAGVPGSFYGQIFPDSSIHIVQASYALNWLSQLPMEVLDEESPAYNKGRIFYTKASDDVADAYANQYAKDVDSFLSVRAKEIVVGGLMLLVMPVIQDGLHRSCITMGRCFDGIGSFLMDMAHEGLISEAQVDSFNLPFYITSPNEMSTLIERNGHFTIEKMKVTDLLLTMNGPVNIAENNRHLRAAFEGILAQHFGSNIVDELFQRLDQKPDLIYSEIMDKRHTKGALLFLALKRK